MYLVVGIVGKIRLNYKWNDISYQEDVDINQTMRFQLSKIPECPCVINEVIYIEDTIYGVSFLLDTCEIDLFGNQIVPFSVPAFEISGTAQLIVAV